MRQEYVLLSLTGSLAFGIALVPALLGRFHCGALVIMPRALCVCARLYGSSGCTLGLSFLRGQVGLDNFACLVLDDGCGFQTCVPQRSNQAC